jgi:hypothetical protein
MSAARRDVVAIVSDTHIGSTVGLCPPTVALDDGGAYLANKGQRWLWECWLAYWQQVQATKPRGGGKRWSIHLGDICEGDHHATSQVITRNKATQMGLAIEIMEPAARWADRLFVVRGTAAHASEAGALEEAIADDLHAVRDEVTGTASWWHLPLEIGGVRLDLAHHPPAGGGRPWTKPAAAMTAAAILTMQAASARRQPADLAVRGHLHFHADSFTAHPVRMIYAPSWQLRTQFAHRLAAPDLADIGGLIVTIEGDVYNVDTVLYRGDPRPAWREPQ